MQVPRLINPALNPNGYIAAAGAVLAASMMVYNAVNHHGVFNSADVISAVGAVLALLARQQVTPVNDPKNGAGVPLVPVTSPLSPVLQAGTAAGIVQVTPNPTGGTIGIPAEANPAGWTVGKQQ